jgi:site-specific recombinase XerD
MEDRPSMSSDVVRQYLLGRFEGGKDWQTVNSDYSAIQKWFKNVLFLEWSLKKLPRPKKEKKLPLIFSKEDIIKIIEAAPTFKQQVLLTTIYVTGMRLSEAIELKITDVDGDRMQIRVNKGKGNKDRMILIPHQLLELLRLYYKAYRPEEYLFNGIKTGRPYSQRAVQLTMQEAKKASKINKRGSIHTLRNCYATHHLELGTDLVFLQDQMGHKNLRTTIRYIGLCVERKKYINHPISSMEIRYLPPTA